MVARQEAQSRPTTRRVNGDVNPARPPEDPSGGLRLSGYVPAIPATGRFFRMPAGNLKACASPRAYTDPLDPASQ